MRSLIITSAMLLSSLSSADIGVDTSFSGLFPYGNIVHSYGYLYLGPIGAIGRYDMPHHDVADTVYGLGLKYAAKNHAFEVSGGLLERQMKGTIQDGTQVTRKGHGFAAMVIYSRLFGDHFRISLPFTLKRILAEDREGKTGDEVPLAARWNFEIFPTFGVRFF